MTGGWLLALVFAAGPGDPPSAEAVRVTVVAILASNKLTRIDPKLEEVAAEVRKRDPALTGFRISRTTSESLPPGTKHVFPLVDDAVAVIVVKPESDQEGRIRVTIKPPQLGEITYTCRCGKFFPIVTRHVTTEGERLIVAVMVKPCRKDD